MTVVAVIYVNEIFPSAVRGKYQAYAIVIGICGTPVTNFIASAVVPLSDWSWRLVYLWGALGIATCSSPGTSRSPPAGSRAGATSTKPTPC